MTRTVPNRAHSRRGILKAAAVGTAAFGLAAAGRAVGGGDAGDSAGGMSVPVVAYVSDPRRGDVTVMVGTREIVRRDRALVARLMAIAKEAGDVVAS